MSERPSPVHSGTPFAPFGTSAARRRCPVAAAIEMRRSCCEFADSAVVEALQSTWQLPACGFMLWLLSKPYKLPTISLAELEVRHVHCRELGGAAPAGVARHSLHPRTLRMLITRLPARQRGLAFPQDSDLIHEIHSKLLINDMKLLRNSDENPAFSCVQFAAARGSALPCLLLRTHASIAVGLAGTSGGLRS